MTYPSDPAERIKDLMTQSQRSRWPMVAGILLIVVLASGAAYWFYLPPDQRVDLSGVKDRAITLARSILNTPVLKASTPPAPAASETEDPDPLFPPAKP